MLKDGIPCFLELDSKYCSASDELENWLQVMASESGKRGHQAAPGSHPFQKCMGVTEEGKTRIGAPVCALGGKAGWKRACSENKTGEMKEKNTSIHFLPPTPFRHIHLK